MTLYFCSAGWWMPAGCNHSELQWLTVGWFNIPISAATGTAAHCTAPRPGSAHWQTAQKCWVIHHPAEQLSWKLLIKIIWQQGWAACMKHREQCTGDDCSGELELPLGKWERNPESIICQGLGGFQPCLCSEQHTELLCSLSDSRRAVWHTQSSTSCHSPVFRTPSLVFGGDFYLFCSNPVLTEMEVELELTYLPLSGAPGRQGVLVWTPSQSVKTQWHQKGQECI